MDTIRRPSEYMHPSFWPPLTTSEAKARQEIYQQLEACVWDIQTQDDMNIIAGLGVAVCEMNLKTGEPVEERYTEWLAEQQQTEGGGGEFTEEQMQWLLVIKDHIASIA